MRRGVLKHHHRSALTPIGWVTVGLLLAVVIGFAIGSAAVWIAAAVILLLVLIGAFGIPRNVEDLNVPPGMTNMPGDITRHERERED